MILITGSLAYDIIMNFPGKFSEHILPDKIHILNVSFLVNDMRKGFGGIAGNIAYSLSLLGIKTSILGLVGDDFRQYREFLIKNGIDTTHIKEISGFFTSSAYGITDKSDNQIWGFYSGADSMAEQLTISKVSGLIDFAVVAPHNPRAMLKFAMEYTAKKIPYLFDPGMQLPWLSGQDLKKAFTGAKIIIGNDYEISVIEKKTGIKDLHGLAYKDKIIITTLGEKGSRVSGGGRSYDIKVAKPDAILDPTGAGDAYRSGFLAGYMHGFDLLTCGQMGSLVSAYSVEKFGTTTHYFSPVDFKRRYRANFGEDLKI